METYTIRNYFMFSAGLLMVGACLQALWLGDIRLTIIYGAFTTANLTLSTVSG